MCSGEGTMMVKCLSVRQPWAGLLVKPHPRRTEEAIKPIENRDWRTEHRGPLLIHAGLTYDIEGHEWIVRNAAELGIDREFIEESRKWPRGAIIGRVRQLMCVQYDLSPWFARGRIGHVYRDPEEFRNPVPYRGMRGLFDVPDAVLKEAA